MAVSATCWLISGQHSDKMWPLLLFFHAIKVEIKPVKTLVFVHFSDFKADKCYLLVSIKSPASCSEEHELHLSSFAFFSPEIFHAQTLAGSDSSLSVTLNRNECKRGDE